MTQNTIPTIPPAADRTLNVQVPAQRRLTCFVRTVGNRHFVCREVYTAAELESVSRLRYHVYRKTYGDFLVKKNPHRLDLDAYDANSVHIGVFEYAGDRHRAVGYMRLITEQTTLAANAVRELATTHPHLASLVAETPAFSLPILRFWDDDAALIQLRNTYSGLSETSRFCLHPELQGQNQTARFAVSSMVALSLDYLDMDSSVLIIVATHQAGFYSLFGFKKLHELMLQIGDAQKPFAIMHIPMCDVAARYGTKDIKANLLAAGSRF
jgi:N-acyl-L-homoserine lactone synthetase